MIPMSSALESCSNCPRVTAATPCVMMDAIGLPGCLDLVHAEEFLAKVDVRGKVERMSDLDPSHAPR